MSVQVVVGNLQITILTIRNGWSVHPAPILKLERERTTMMNMKNAYVVLLKGINVQLVEMLEQGVFVPANTIHLESLQNHKS